MRLISISLKYGPWRDALLSAYRKSRGSTVSRSAGVRERAEWILDILQSTCQEMNGVIPEAWIQHLDHAISHCSGLVPTLTRLGVLRSVKGSGPGVRKMHFGKQSRFKRFCRGVEERALALQRIAKYIPVADKIGDLAGPRTCQEWIDSNASLVKSLQGLGCPGVQESKKRRCFG